VSTMDTNNNIRTLVSTGEVAGLITSLDPERREDYVLLNPDTNGPDSAVTIAMVGQAVMVMSGREVVIRLHDHSPEDNDQCWQGGVEQTGASVAAHNAVAIQLRENGTAQEMLHAGAPLPLVGLLTGVDLSPLLVM
jgi:hypothetical protein